MISVWKIHTNREWLPVVASKWKKGQKNKSSIWPNWLTLRKEDTDKKSVLIVMATNTAAQFLKSISHHSMKYLYLLFSSILYLSLHQSVLVSSFWSLRLLPALCSVLSYFPYLSQSIFLFVLSAFSGHSMNYRCQGTACAHVPLQMMNSCKSFHRWKTQINGDI